MGIYNHLIDPYLNGVYCQRRGDGQQKTAVDCADSDVNAYFALQPVYFVCSPACSEIILDCRRYFVYIESSCFCLSHFVCVCILFVFQIEFVSKAIME